MDIAIIGTGLKPFGRHDGESAIDMGVVAAQAALNDAGLSWSDIQLAFSGSLEVLQPDTMIKHLGLTGIPFTTLYNGCATGGNLLLSAAHAITAGSLIVVESTATTTTTGNTGEAEKSKGTRCGNNP